MAQKAFMAELDRIYEQAGIVYAAFKGAHVREIVHADPSVRSANDIDILVSPTQREAAAEALVAAGFEMRADATNISHEATLVRGPIVVDLHWDILRPG